MENLDLNLYNYELKDLLILFKLSDDFTAEEFKNAKNIVYAVHPDKCELDKEYFIFFLNAYKLLLKVAEFRFRNNNAPLDFENIKNDFFDKSEEEIAKKFTSNKNFNEKFNDLFEKHCKKNEYGYGDWLSSNEDEDLSYEKRKENSRALTIQNDIETFTFSNNIIYGNLDRETSYGNSDLKNVYTNESVIGITDNDLKNMQTAKTVEELRNERSINIDPLNEIVCEKYMNKLKAKDNIETTERIYKLIVEEENNLKNKKNFWANLKQLKN
ncbi:MAG: hypothetical protein CMG00_07590 [Candidatus Marinimicrobia bacterium]|nr:hypothetical protein [Candidatus Neomarinimicrobiota bacterium]|tara:strand:- start:621 stop:1430 length:810 start_codon:yes stop_codon:yes gene_type:complete